MPVKNAISIAVLPFENFSEQESTSVFCSSFCIDLITELSFFRQFSIMAYQTTRHFTGIEEDVGKLVDWDIDYYIRGSFRDDGNKLRVNAQLINARSGRLIWANKFEAGTEELMTLQDNLVLEVVSAFQHQVNEDLLAQKRHKQKVDIKAYEYWLYGSEALKRGTLEADLEARAYFQKALEMEPEYSLAYSGMSLSYFNEWSCQLWDRWEVSKNGAFEWAQKAIELDEDNYIAAAIIGRVFLYQGAFESAEYYLRRSLQLNANDPSTLIQIATSLVYLGFAPEAKDWFNRALELNPARTNTYNALGAFIYFELGEFERAGDLAIHSNPNVWIDTSAFYAAIFYFLGDSEKMKLHWSQFLQNFRLKIAKNDNTTEIEAIRWMKEVNPFRYESAIEPFWEYISGHEYSTGEKEKLPSVPETKSGLTFRKEGEVWIIQYAGISGMIPEIKGFNDLYELIMSPGKSFHCSEMMGAGIAEAGEAVIDERARSEYYHKLNTIRQDLEESEMAGNYRHTTQLRKQYDELIDHLSKVFDNKGRVKKTGSTTDKTRSAITWRIRSAISKIEKVNPALGKHFNNCIKTGTYCQYVPEMQMDWNT